MISEDEIIFFPFLPLCSIVAGSSPYLALNDVTGEVSFTTDLADLTKDTTEKMTVMAKDHGQPPLDSTGLSDKTM